MQGRELITQKPEKTFTHRGMRIDEFVLHDGKKTKIAWVIHGKMNAPRDENGIKYPIAHVTIDRDDDPEQIVTLMAKRRVQQAFETFYQFHLD